MAQNPCFMASLESAFDASCFLTSLTREIASMSCAISLPAVPFGRASSDHRFGAWQIRCWLLAACNLVNK